MAHHFRVRFWVEAGLAVFTALLAGATQMWPNWVELVFRVDPDHGSGSLERVLVGVCLAAFLASVLLAGTEFRSQAAHSA
ncbi:MAG TPA: hypothetical protein VMV09_02525 [Candidatus Saccharimonadales bacterium]|nr:hypothetical protein [Candidatus Saccharimonadales bacterium]